MRVPVSLLLALTLLSTPAIPQRRCTHPHCPVPKCLRVHPACF